MARLVYDCEIGNLVPPRENRFEPGYHWTDFFDMQLLRIAICDIDSEERYAFSDREGDLPMSEFFQHLEKWRFTYEIWGFDSIEIKDKLLKAKDINFKSSCDLSHLISKFGCGSIWIKPEGYCYSLDYIANANGFHVTKDCLHNSLVTARLIKLFESGKVIDPNTGKMLKLAPYI